MLYLVCSLPFPFRNSAPCCVLLKHYAEIDHTTKISLSVSPAKYGFWWTQSALIDRKRSKPMSGPAA